MDEGLAETVFSIKKALTIDLITRMVHPDPDQRVTAIEALTHPIFCM